MGILADSILSMLFYNDFLNYFLNNSEQNLIFLGWYGLY